MSAAAAAAVTAASLGRREMKFPAKIARKIQVIIVAFIAATVFPRSRMPRENEADGAAYIGALIFALIVHMFGGYAELAMTIERLPVFYKHRDLLFYPSWVFTLPYFLLRIPFSILESAAWVIITYYIIGFDPAASRFFKQFLLILLVQQMAAGLFRAIAGICRSMVIANSGGNIIVVLTFVLGGFILSRDLIPKGWIWGYWNSPLTYAYNAIAVNEFLDPRWKKLVPNRGFLGQAVLEDFSIFPEEKWYWIGAGALLGYTILFNILFTIALMYLNPLEQRQVVISEEMAIEMEDNGDESKESPRIKRTERGDDSFPRALSKRDGNNTREMMVLRMSGRSSTNEFDQNKTAYGGTRNRGMALPFTPLAMSFGDVNYYVDMPVEMKGQGVVEDRLQLLRGVTGAFRPGVVTALMGVSGAGKTTLMDVLAGRKTGGYIEGDIWISGYPKNQETFARISGYCEQTDIHSPQVTVLESLIYSAFLRLPEDVSDKAKMVFVQEVLELVELDNLKNAIVGLPGVTGLSTEQRKRLTIAVELVSNPSIIFMDEPTSGLDARAAAIVMRAVRNTVDTGRTIVCTIHQPSIDIFEAFDELLLLKRGGQVIYYGQLGQNSQHLVEYFEAIPGVSKIKDMYNPATWMLEMSSVDCEARLGIDFAEHYKSSSLFQRNKALVHELSQPVSGTRDLHFQTQFSRSTFEQFKMCLWKQWWSYWRTPDYNLVRFFFTLAMALLVGSIFWKIGITMKSSIDLRIIIGSMYAAVMFVGISNCTNVLPVVAIERSVFYRERAAGMYSAIPYALAQVVVEIPYVIIQAFYYTLIVYSMMSFPWTAAKFLWFFFISFMSFLYFTYYGMMCVSISPNYQVASILSSTFYALFNLFSGFLIPRPALPVWWVWYSWICPLSWTVYGLIVTQFSDVEDYIEVPGESTQVRIKDFIMAEYGFKSNFIGVVATVLVLFVVFFAFVFTLCIKKLNFQQR